MNIEDIKTVMIVGAGTMGQQIGAQSALFNYEVVLYDIDQTLLDKALERIKILFGYLVKTGQTTTESVKAALDRISTTSDMGQGAKKADIISESVPEDPQLKGSVFARLNELCPAHTIFTTNTSTLLPSQFAQACGRPKKLVALHFHDVRVTRIVDVMGHAGSSAESVELVTRFAERIGQIPIVLKKENPGYVFNTMLSNLFNTAQTLAANGITDPTEIDRAWMGVTRMNMGPFGLMDSVGIDTVCKVTAYWAEKNDDDQMRKNIQYLKKYVEKGDLGQKTGRGFYTYPKPAYSLPDFLEPGRDSKVEP